MVNNSTGQRKFQAFLELHKENNPREQSRHSHWNPDRGSWNKVPRGWESVGDERADGDDDRGDVGLLEAIEDIIKKINCLTWGPRKCRYKSLS